MRRLAAFALGSFLLAVSAVQAMETDQFLALDVDLQDSAPVMNAHLNQVIRERLARLNQRPANNRENLACEDVTRFVIKGFRQRMYTKMARWAHNDPSVDRYPSPSVNRMDYYRQSVLGRPYYSHLRIPLGRTVNVGGVYFGVDKLGHFLSFGLRYHQRFLRAISKGLAEEEAEREVILWGLKRERTIEGKTSTGITSYADLEANYQGLLFALSLCREDGSAHFALDGNSNWVLRGQADLRDYVNPDWDETFNPNHYVKRRWKNIQKRVEVHCHKLRDPIVLQRFKGYEKIHQPSLNARIVRELESRHELPDRSIFSLEQVCGQPVRAAESGSGTSRASQDWP